MANAVLSSMPDWADTWVAALTNPSVKLYQRLSSDPEATNKRAYTWLLASISLLILVFLALAVLRIPTHITPFRGLAMGKGGSFPVSLACGLPIALVIAAIGFTIEVALLNFFATLVGKVRHNHSERLAFVLSAIQSPLALVYLVFFILPSSPLTTLALLVVASYHVYTIALALQAVYRFRWQQAAIVILLNATLITGILFLFNLVVPR